MTQYAGFARHASATWIQSDERAWAVEYEGRPGDKVFLLHSKSLAFIPVPGFSGVWLLPSPIFAPAVPTLVLSGTGRVTLNSRVPRVPPDKTRQRLYSQALFLPPQGDRFLSGPVHLYILNRDVGPDCNGNGISDYVDVIEGLAPDLNGNLIPDTCPGG